MRESVVAWRALAFLLAALPVASLAGAARASAPVAVSKPASKPGAGVRPSELVPEGPLEFRCDKGQLFTKTNRSVCSGNVVIRRGDILVCCSSFDALLDPSGELERLTCKDDVRARRGEETMWADRAELVPRTGDLVLTGRPIVRRGRSFVGGERVVVNIDSEQARVDKPRARIVTEELEGAGLSPTAVAPAGPAPLPATCPLPRAPRR